MKITHRKTLAVLIMLVIVGLILDVYQSLQNDMTTMDLGRLTINFNNTIETDSKNREERMNWCKQLDSKILNETRYFRFENTKKRFVTMSSLLQLPSCIFCTLVCKLSIIGSGVASHPNTHEFGPKMIGYHSPWKQEILDKLRNIVYEKLLKLQSPKKCSSVRRLACRVAGHGLGAQLHHVTYCLLVAYMTNRTLILQSHAINYRDEYSDVFLPISTCSIEHSDFNDIHLEENLEGIFNSTVDVITIPDVYTWRFGKPDFISLAVPDNLAFALAMVIDDPPGWWISQFVRYIFRLRSDVEINLQREIDAKFDGVIAGVHIRRTDKIKEAKYQAVEKYMSHVTDFFDGLALGTQPKKLYLATDESSVLDEVEAKYPSYDIVYNRSLTKEAGKQNDTLFAIIRDIYLLSNCDFLVCTFSSNVCRLMYELSIAKGRNVTEMFRNIDSFYYIFGSKNNRQIYIAMKNRNPESPGEMKMSVGDIIERWKHKQDVLYGKNLSTRKSGIFAVDDLRRVWPIAKSTALDI